MKPAIAFAQTYFAVQTRKQEIIEQRLLDIARITAREKLSQSEKKLSSIIYERGVDEKGFAAIRSKGDKALFGGFSTQDMKRKLGVPAAKPLADFLPTLNIKAKDLAIELTSHNVMEKDLQGEPSITTEHIDNNIAVRTILKKRGVSPETLPAAEDTSKVKRRLAGPLPFLCYFWETSLNTHYEKNLFLAIRYAFMHRRNYSCAGRRPPISVRPVSYSPSFHFAGTG